LPLAAALDLQAGERVRWQLLARSELRLIRLEPPPARKRVKKQSELFQQNRLCVIWRLPGGSFAAGSERHEQNATRTSSHGSTESRPTIPSRLRRITFFCRQGAGRLIVKMHGKLSVPSI